MDTVQLRIQRLERQNRLFKHAIILLALLVSSLCFLVGFTSNRIPDEVVARSVKVLGENGHNSAALSTTKDGWVSLSFRDLSDSLRFSVLMTPSGKPTIAFFSENRARLTLGSVSGDKGEEYSIALHDQGGRILWKPPTPNPSR